MPFRDRAAFFEARSTSRAPNREEGSAMRVVRNRNKNFHARGTESTPVPARRSMPNAPVRAAAGSSRRPPPIRGDRRRPFRHPWSAPAAPPPRTRPTTSASRHPPTLAFLPTHCSVPARHPGAAPAPARGPARASTARRSRCARMRRTTAGSVTKRRSPSRLCNAGTPPCPPGTRVAAARPSGDVAPAAPASPRQARASWPPA